LRPRTSFQDLNNSVNKLKHSYYVIYDVIIYLTARSKKLRKLAFVTFDFDIILDFYIGVLIVL